MPNSDPSPEIRFQKGRAKTGGRQKGTKDKIPRCGSATEQGTKEGPDTEHEEDHRGSRKSG